MTRRLLAEFQDPNALLAAVGRVDRAGHRPVDAFTPFPVDGLAERLESRPGRIRIAMLLAGLGIAAFAYALQWYSAVLAYPLDVGGRPLHSWPVYLLAPFEVGAFTASLAGFLALLWRCGLPRLHDPLFAVPGFERATQDRFFLLAETAAADQEINGLRHVLEGAGAVTVTEVWT